MTASPTPPTRRRLLAGAAALSGVALGGGLLPLSLRRAISESAQAAEALSLPQVLQSIKHVVILMQENRSFDHYFGTFPGARGFADPWADPAVFTQYDAVTGLSYQPFHYDTATTNAQATPQVDHGWSSQHSAWDFGAMDNWLAAKTQFDGTGKVTQSGVYSLGYFEQQDIPFHWALAQAFTLCDAYHCSVLGPTFSNRLFLMTGTNYDKHPAASQKGPGGWVEDPWLHYPGTMLSWPTFPELLTNAGVSWKIYQQDTSYEFNPLSRFTQYQDTSSVLYANGMQITAADQFEQDVANNSLPAVSWLLPTSAECEHPKYWPAAGAEYIAGKLAAIAQNPEVWNSTLFILTYDENDGQFDHVRPYTAPAGTAGEYLTQAQCLGQTVTIGGPVGLGFRVPCILVSPWTVGGNVYPGTANPNPPAAARLDHTSIIRLIEQILIAQGVSQSYFYSTPTDRLDNITAWRLGAAGDMTAALVLNSAAPAPQFPGDPALQVAAAAADYAAAQQEVANNPPPALPNPT